MWQKSAGTRPLITFSVNSRSTLPASKRKQHNELAGWREIKVREHCVRFHCIIGSAFYSGKCALSLVSLVWKEVEHFHKQVSGERGAGDKIEINETLKDILQNASKAEKRHFINLYKNKSNGFQEIRAKTKIKHGRFISCVQEDAHYRVSLWQ